MKKLTHFFLKKIFNIFFIVRFRDSDQYQSDTDPKYRIEPSQSFHLFIINIQTNI